jgi:hypothetical protein
MMKKLLIAACVLASFSPAVAQNPPPSIRSGGQPTAINRNLPLRQPSNLDLQMQVSELSNKVEELTSLVQALSGQVSDVHKLLTRHNEREATRYMYLNRIERRDCIVSEMSYPKTIPNYEDAANKCSGHGMDSDGPPVDLEGP